MGEEKRALMRALLLRQPELSSCSSLPGLVGLEDALGHRCDLPHAQVAADVDGF